MEKVNVRIQIARSSPFHGHPTVYSPIWSLIHGHAANPHLRGPPLCGSGPSGLHGHQATALFHGYGHPSV